MIKPQFPQSLEVNGLCADRNSILKGVPTSLKCARMRPSRYRR